MPNGAVELINGIRDQIFIFMVIIVAFSFAGMIVARTFASTKSSRLLVWQLFSLSGIITAMYVWRLSSGN